MTDSEDAVDESKTGPKTRRKAAKDDVMNMHAMLRLDLLEHDEADDAA